MLGSCITRPAHASYTGKALSPCSVVCSCSNSSRRRAPGRRCAAPRTLRPRNTRCRVNAKLQVVFVSTEVAPWSKSGGLGDVVASLPISLAQRGHRVMTVAPRYGHYPGIHDTGLMVPVEVGTAEADGPRGPPNGATAADTTTAAHNGAAAAGHARSGADQRPLASAAAAAGVGAHGDAAGNGTGGGDLGLAADEAPRARCQRAKARGKRAPRRRPAATGADTAAAVAVAVAPTAPAPLQAAAAAAPGGAPADSVAVHQPRGADTAAAPAPPSPSPSPSTSVSYARFYMCQDRGVLRVFVDHPAFGPCEGGAGASGAAPVYTYGEGDGSWGLDLQARNSILCQAALAAPVLLWYANSSEMALWQSGHGVLPSLGHAPAQAAGQPPRQEAMALQNGVARPVAADPLAELRLQKRLRKMAATAGMQQPEEVAAAAAAAAAAGTAAAAAGPSAGTNSSQPGGAHNLVFVSNDWPTALLPLWLQLYEDVAAQLSQALQMSMQQVLGTRPPAVSEAFNSDAAIATAAALPATAAATSPGAAAPVTSIPGLGLSQVVGADDFDSIPRPQQATAAAARPPAPAMATAKAANGASASNGAPAAPLAAPASAEPPSREPLLVGVGVRSRARQHAASGAAAEAPALHHMAADAAPWDVRGLPPAPPSGWHSSTPPPLPPEPTPSPPPPQQHQHQDGPLQEQQQQHLEQQQQLVAEHAHAGHANSTSVAGPSYNGAMPERTAGQQADAGEPGPVVLHTRGAVANAAAPSGAGQGPLAAAAEVLGSSDGTAAHAADAGEPQVLRSLAEQEEVQSQLLAQLFYFLGPLAPGARPQGRPVTSATGSSADAAAGQAADPNGADVNGAPAGGTAAGLLAEAGDGTAAATAAAAQPPPLAEEVSGSAGGGGVGPAAVPPPSPNDQLQASLTAFRQLAAERLRGARVVFALHNFAFQGLFSSESFWRLGLPLLAMQQMLLGGGGPLPVTPAAPPSQPSTAVGAQTDDDGEVAGGNAATSSSSPAAAGACSVAGGKISWLKAALLASSALVTVSQGYARELTGGPHTQAGGGGPGTQPSPPTPTPGAPTAQPGADVGWPAVAGDELAAILRARGLAGIRNGLDLVAWDPATDALLPAEARYDASSVAAGKARAKALLQGRLGLAVDPRAPLVGFVGRLDEQKGVDVILAALPALLGPPASAVLSNPALQSPRLAAAQLPLEVLAVLAAAAGEPVESLLLQQQQQQASQPAAADATSGRGAAASDAPGSGGEAAAPAAAAFSPTSSASPMQLAMLGEGDAWLAAALPQLAVGWPRRAAGVVAFDEALSHLLLAGCDYLLVPSRWEPCGLVALAALRYGTLPIVAPVGGLPDALLPQQQPAEPAATAAGSLAQAVSSGSGSQQTAGQGDDVAAAADAIIASVAAPSSVADTAAADGELPLGYVMDMQIGQLGDSQGMRAAAASLERAVRAALSEYGTSRFEALRQRCMERDVSWSQPALEWEHLLERVVQGGGTAAAVAAAPDEAAAALPPGTDTAHAGADDEVVAK